MNELYRDFKNQFSKLGSCENFKIAVLYDKYFVKKVMIGKNILMVVIAETNGLDMGQLDSMFDEFQRNFKSIDENMDKYVERDD